MCKILQFPIKDRGRTPLYVDYVNGHVRGGGGFQEETEEGFAERISKVRASLERINALMRELKDAAPQTI